MFGAVIIFIKETKLIENITILLGKDAPSRARKLIETNNIIFASKI